MEKLFKLKENGTTVRIEVIAGLTTFMTMAYIIALNPNLLTGFGANGGQPLWNAVFLATCLSAGIGTICMALLANKPFAMAPGMGLNSFFAVIVANIVSITGMTYLQSFRAALSIILIEGIVFIVLSVLNIREKIVQAIPLHLRLAISPAIGLMLINIGLGSNVGVFDANGNCWYILRDFFGSLTAGYAAEQMGEAYPTMVLSVITVFVGLIIMVVLARKNIKANVLIGMLAAAVVYWIGEAAVLGINPFASLQTASFVPAFGDLVSQTLFHVDFKGFLEIGWFTAITLVITFCIIDMFDTIGTLVGTASRANMLDEKGNMPQMKQALLSDAIGTCSGALLGTSTVTTFVESASGVESGGRTGLSSIVSGLLFIACIFIAPIAGIIPAAATSAALVYVGTLMLLGLKNIRFESVDQIVPVALMLIAMPISGSIGHAIGIAIVSHTLIQLFSGKWKDISILTYIIAALFLIKFFLVI